MHKRTNICLSTVLAALLLLTTGCSIGGSKKLDRKSSARLITEYLTAENDGEIRMIFSEGPTYAGITMEDRADMALLESELAHVKAVPQPLASDRVCLFLTEEGRARAEQEWEEKEYEWESDASEDCPYDKSWLITLGSLESLEV